MEIRRFPDYTAEITPGQLEGVDMVIMESEIIFTMGISESNIFGAEPFIYPNPVCDQASIVLRLKKPATVSLAIIDPAGRILSKEICEVNGQLNHHFDLSGLAKGIYFVKVEANQEVSILPLVKN